MSAEKTADSKMSEAEYKFHKSHALAYGVVQQYLAQIQENDPSEMWPKGIMPTSGIPFELKNKASGATERWEIKLAYVDKNYIWQQPHRSQALSSAASDLLNEAIKMYAYLVKIMELDDLKDSNLVVDPANTTLVAFVPPGDTHIRDLPKRIGIVTVRSEPQA